MDKEEVSPRNTYTFLLGLASKRKEKATVKDRDDRSPRSRSFGEQEEEGARERVKCNERKGEQCAGKRRGREREREREKEREREVFILEKGFGLAFGHPLLTSVQPLRRRIF